MKNLLLIFIVVVLGFVTVERVTSIKTSESVEIVQTDSPKVFPEVLALLGLGLLMIHVTNNPRKPD